MKNIGAALWSAISSAFLVGALYTFLRFSDPDPSAGPATFLFIFVMCPTAIIASALGFLGLVLYFRPSQKAKRRIWRLLAIMMLSGPSFALFLFLAPAMHQLFAK
jgi:hypothetical protein